MGKSYHLLFSKLQVKIHGESLRAGSLLGVFTTNVFFYYASLCVYVFIGVLYMITFNRERYVP